MKVADIILALGAFGTGSWAAYKWYLASVGVVRVDLGYTYLGTPGTYTRAGIVVSRRPESTDEDSKHADEISAVWEAINKAASLNKEAAIWTAASTALTGLSAIAGALSN